MLWAGTLALAPLAWAGLLACGWRTSTRLWGACHVMAWTAVVLWRLLLLGG
jgi:hypothetical protein